MATKAHLKFHYYRRNKRPLIFPRENPDIFQAFHETEVKFDSTVPSPCTNSIFALNVFSINCIADGIESTTSLKLNAQTSQSLDT